MRRSRPGAGVAAARKFVRSLSPRLEDDRSLSGDIEAVAHADPRRLARCGGGRRDRSARMTVAGSMEATVEALCGDLGNIRAPRGTGLSARSWQTEAPLRMLLNNLDSRGRRASRVAGRLRGLGQSRARSREPEGARPHAAAARRRRDDARPERKARRRFPHARPGAPRADLERDARATLGDVGRVPEAGGARADDVRADDGGQLDLHRHAGDPPGDVSDVRRRGGTALRTGRPPRAHRAHGRAGRHGRRAAACGRAARRRDPLRRGRSVANRAPARDALSRRGHRVDRRGGRARSVGG